MLTLPVFVCLGQDSFFALLAKNSIVILFCVNINGSFKAASVLVFCVHGSFGSNPFL
ncbi:hypothetical protein RO3G_02419 [Rhizopus delemar RA 99-880]|uniref:Uncharacterized protein n=1 Tax=Rhizopus delemar (strain RA 99-880 / ATCC MYA-4621 / FGSC 9543 / NRRL 43880) TaxID=246409 RepID=I1BND5_RHIO9|nr:hypothetical protein RO3G_02419 [Rhizopus delemar RA 99-880]|eukprot:EIE77715.1 hypothetical protein RO3G_02419 [Rhizopus delemar RA 99-880]